MTGDARMGRARTVAILLGILGLAAVLRVASAGGFWIDEVFSAANAKAGPATFLERSRGEPHSPWPIYYMLLFLWQHAFASVAGMKGLSVLLSLAGVLALYGVGRSLQGPPAGLLAALLAATNPLLAWYGGEIRMYALLLLALTGTLGAAVRAERRRRVRDGLLFGLLASVSVYAHVFAAFPVLVLTVFVAVLAGRRAVIAALVLGAAAAIPALLLVAAQAGYWLGWKGSVAGAGYWSSPMNLLAAAQALFTAYALPLEGVSPTRLAGLAAVAALVGAPVLAAARGRAPGVRLLAVLVAVGIAAPWLVQIRTRMYSPRFALTALPPLLLLVAAGLATMPRRRAAALTAGLVLAGLAAVAGHAGRTDWREVSEYLRRERPAGSDFNFEGGNVIALQEWFGPHFRTTDGVHTDGSRELWAVRITPPGDVTPPAPFVRTVRRFGPERRLVEDEAPWVVAWRLP